MGIFDLPREDTIVAISTPLGRGALGIVRISGNHATEISSSAIRGSLDLAALPGGSAKVVSIDFGNGLTDGGVVTVWRAPKSYTGEDLIEFTIHGSPFLLEELLRRLVENGARAAAPGEFTLRAVLNGKMSLSEAGAVDAMIGAIDLYSAKAAGKALSGELNRRIERFLSKLEEIEFAGVAQTEFPEHFEDISIEKLANSLDSTERELSALIENARKGRKLAKGAQIVIAGTPNVGKSTLANALSGAESSIVHHLPGTTRDIVETNIRFGRFEASLVDTAGLRECADEVENIGVTKARARLFAADLVLFVIDGSEPFSPEENRALEAIEDTRRLVVVNKIDLGRVRRIQDAIEVSALTGEGLDSLKEKISASLAVPSEEAVWAGLWQIELLEAAKACLEGAREACKMELSDAAFAEISSAVQFLRESVGRVENRDIIERVLEGFCVGK